ncbi:MAG: DUF2157 domain-containing protein [Burkholderiales bacterium]|nr:MAG: DUF2157 domain-containing protein [Burkholderiales bacterium]
MEWRILVAPHARGLSRVQRRELLAMGGVGVAPAPLVARLPQALLGLAGFLAGLGLTFAVAANWGAMSRLLQFAVLQAAVALGAIGVIAWPRGRLPLGLWCLLSTGGLLAYFGQTYQTGADAWQLFALWSALVLPLALGVRSDALWSAWVLVTMTAVALWMSTLTAHRWDADADVIVHLPGWGLALTLVLALGSPWGRRAGADLWSSRTAAFLALFMVTATAVIALFGHEPALMVALALLVLGLMAGSAARPSSFDVFTLSGAALAIDVLLMGVWMRAMFGNGRSRGDEIGLLLLTGLVAAALLALTVTFVLNRQRAVARQSGGRA